MKNVLKLEELAQFALAVYAFYQWDMAWWVFWALLLVPDISMLGYAVNPRIGAYAYNLFHHKGVAIAVGLLGLYLNETSLQLAGLILFAHAAMDRMFGYGLKYRDSFQNTHLGRNINFKI